MNDRLIKCFMDLVKIDSESGNERAVLSYLKQVLEKELHAQCLVDEYGNLLARIGAKSCSSFEPIVLGCHADTVKPGSGIEPILEHNRIVSKGNTILGGDDKAGIAEILEALRSSPKNPPIDWIITREEEVGLQGAKHFDISKLRANIGFLLDSDKIDTIIVGGPSHTRIDVEIIGRGAHAGMEPEKGISAIQAAAYSISRMRLGRLDEESMANIGTIHGGTVRNAIPERVIIEAESRSLNHQKCLNQADEIKSHFEEGVRLYGATANIKTELSYRAMRIPDDARPVIIAKQAIEECGLKPKTDMMTGGTDASIFNEKGVQMVILGMGVGREHTVEEYADVSEMGKMVEILKKIFAQFCS